MTSEAEKERKARLGGLAYFGRMTASISHELNNVVTIVGEVAGLIEDMTALAERGRSLTPEKLRVQCERIGRQVERGKELVRRMNALGHSTDREREDVELDRAVAAAVDLLRRLAELEGVRVVLTPGAGGAEVTCSRFELQQAVYTLVDALLAMEPPPKEIRVSTRFGEGRAAVEVACSDAGASEAEAARLHHAALLAERLSGEIASARGVDVVVTLRLPAQG